LKTLAGTGHSSFARAGQVPEMQGRWQIVAKAWLSLTAGRSRCIAGV
jgi:hypothetical protein